MSQISYANPEAQRPGLGPVTNAEAEAETATKNRGRATLPFWISFWAHVFFLLQYWLPETSGFPNSRWWMDQLAPLASTWLTSRGEPQVAAQEGAGLAPVVMLMAGIGLVYMSRTHYWWGRIGILVPASLGLLAGLGILVRLLTTGGNRTSALGLILLVLYLVYTGYSAAQGVQDRLGKPPAKTWYSGLPVLVTYAIFAPLPTAVGRWFFAPELRDVANVVKDNTVALRMSALWTASTPLLYFSGLLVGVAIWVLYRLWPQRLGTQVTTLLIGMAVALIALGGFGLTAGGLASLRTAQLQRQAPAENSFSCGAWTRPNADPNDAVLTLAVTGSSCKTVAVFEGYRQQTQPRSVPVSLSPIEALTPERAKIGGEEVGAVYGDVVVLAATDRIDRAPTSLLALRVIDTSEVWSFPCADQLSVRFSGVEPTPKPERGQLTEEGETVPQIVVGCAGKVQSLDPQTGKRLR